MNQRTKLMVQLGVLAAIATAAGLFAYYGVYESDRVETAKKDVSDRLFSPQLFGEKEPDGGSPVAEFIKLSVFSKGELTVLERQAGGEWLVVAPLKTRADQLTVDGVISQLQTQKLKRKLDDKPDDETLARYGLKKPEFIIDATAEVGASKTLRTTKLFGGVENTFDGSIYVRRDADPAVYQAEGGIRFALQKSTFDLRNKTVMQFDTRKAVKIAMKSKDNEWTLTRNDDKATWTVVAPCAPKQSPESCAPSLADTTVVAAIMSGLEAERAVAFDDATTTNITAAGLDSPAVDTTITHEDGSTVRLRVSRPEIDGGASARVLRDDQVGQTLASVAPTAPGHLDRNVYDLKDHSIAYMKRELVKKVVIHEGTGPDVVLAIDSSPDAGSNTWRVTAPTAGAAKVMRISSLVWTIGAMRFSSAGEEHPKDWTKYGIDAKSRSFSFLDEAGKELGRMTIGAPVPNKPNIVYVRGLREQVLETDGSRFGELPSKLEDFLDAPPANKDAGQPGDAG